MTYSGRVDIQQVIDESPFSGFHWLLIVLGFLVLAIDGFDTAAMGYIAPTLSTEWGIHKQDLGPVLSAALLGLSLGALIAGPVSDRMGRKRVLVFSCLFFGLGEHRARPRAQSLNTLTLWRFLTGLGLGAAMPNAITLISEFAPQRCRAMAINTMYCGFPLGAAGGGAISSSAYPSPWLAKRAADRRDCAADFNGAAGAAVAGVGEVSGAARERRRPGFAASPAGSPAARWIASRAFS